MNNRIRNLLLLAAVCLFLTSGPLSAQTPRTPALSCRLIVQNQKLSAGETPSARVEIENRSEQTIVITYNSSPWEFLDLKLTDPSGKVISQEKYGNRFSPYSPNPEQKLTLRASATFSREVDVFGTSKEIDRMAPGDYRVVATFVYGALIAASEPVTLSVEK